MANISFGLNYVKAKETPSVSTADYEKIFSSQDEALKFCVRLAELEGKAIYLIRLVCGVEDGIFEGEPLARGI